MEPNNKITNRKRHKFLTPDSPESCRLALLKFIKANYHAQVVEKSDVISPNELDIYLPEAKLAFEYNDLFLHNQLHVNSKYHLEKTLACIDKGIHLIHIYGDDWQDLKRRAVIKSRILNLMGKSTVKLFARKCKVGVVSPTVARDFCETNHIQGKCLSKINLGLYYQNELVSLMTFGTKRVHMGNSTPDPLKWELLRFCSKLNYNVIGAASKLFSAFVKDNEYTEIVSYADRSWSSGRVYQKLGFTYDSETKPNYFYIIDGKRKGRFSFAKHVLVKKGHDASKTEKEIMFALGLYRIHDSGSLKFVYRKENAATTESEKTES